MSALGGIADIHRSCCDVPFVTKAQGPGGGGGGRGGRGGGGFGLEGWAALNTNLRHRDDLHAKADVGVHLLWLIC